jgi:UDP-N-acetyl-2-amino-2-deoxyglucuronate dehydrogenase
MIGAAGYIAPRHMKAIRDVGGDLLAAMDINDSVGIIDSHFPDAHFFTEFERFQQYVDDVRRSGDPLHYIAIASPNYLHDPHMRFALNAGADAICEKPIVLESDDIDRLRVIEQESGKNIYTILQLRLHPAILEFRDRVAQSSSDTKEDVELTYITSRGNWYYESWKGDERKSGGIATNIGVHFFDMLGFVYGNLQQNEVHLQTHDKAGGYLEFERARVRWFLSLDVNDVPELERSQGKRTYRTLTANGKSVEFSDGFTDLHTKCYEEIIAGRGFGLEENRPAIAAVAKIRRSAPVISRDRVHPLVEKAGS